MQMSSSPPVWFTQSPFDPHLNCGNWVENPQPHTPLPASLLRHLDRRLDRSCWRALPGHRRGPDELSQALTAFTRALRCHRRLAKLAPRFFDSAVVDREAREREEQRQWRTLCKLALDQVYGCDTDPAPSPDPAAESPPLPGVRTQRAVERELAGWDFWMAFGRTALARYRRRCSHVLRSLGRIVRMFRIASEFGNLAVGINRAKRKPAKL